MEKRKELAKLMRQFDKNPKVLSKKQLIFVLKEVYKNFEKVLEATDLHCCKICELANTSSMIEPFNLCTGCSDSLLTYNDQIFLDFLDKDVFHTVNYLPNLPLRTRNPELVWKSEESFKLIKYIEGKTIKDIDDFWQLHVPGKFLILNFSVYQYYKSKPKSGYLGNYYYYSFPNDFETYLLINKTRFWRINAGNYVSLPIKEIYSEVIMALLALNRIPAEFIPRPLKQKIFRYFLDD